MTSVPGKQDLPSQSDLPGWMTRFTLGDFTDPYGYTQKVWARQTLLSHIAWCVPAAVRTLWDAVFPLLDGLPPPSWILPNRLLTAQEAEIRATLDATIRRWQRHWQLGTDTVEWGLPAALATTHWWAEARSTGELGDELIEPFQTLKDAPFLSAEFIKGAVTELKLGSAPLEVVKKVQTHHPRHYSVIFTVEDETTYWNPLLERRVDAYDRIRADLLRRSLRSRLSSQSKENLDAALDSVEALAKAHGARRVRRPTLYRDPRPFLWLVGWQLMSWSLAEIASKVCIPRQDIRAGAVRAARLAKFPLRPRVTALHSP